MTWQLYYAKQAQKDAKKLAASGLKPKAQELLALNEIDLETSIAITARTSALLGEDHREGEKLSSIAKVHCSEAIGRIIDRSIQLCGGDGVTDQLPLALYAQEVRPFRIYDGSTETHKWAIAKRASSRRRREIEAGEQPLDRVDPDGRDAWAER